MTQLRSMSGPTLFFAVPITFCGDAAAESTVLDGAWLQPQIEMSASIRAQCLIGVSPYLSKLIDVLLYSGNSKSEMSNASNIRPIVFAKIAGVKVRLSWRERYLLPCLAGTDLTITFVPSQSPPDDSA